MKINNVVNDARKKALKIEADGNTYSFPYSKLRLVPTASDPIVEVFADPDLGNEAFTYRLSSGAEDTIHIDAVLEINKDPDYLQELLLHKLTVEAMEGVEESGLGKRQLARLLGTSPSQLYRLLDPKNSGKSVGQMLALLNLVNKRVDIQIHPKSSALPRSTGVFEVYQDKGGSYRFRLKNADGRVVLSSDPYRSKRSCLRAINRVRNYAIQDSQFERKMTEGGRFQFRIKAKNNHVIARSPAFKDPARRDAALATVRRKAAEVEVEEASA